MNDIPHDAHFESSLALMKDPYRYISKTSESLHTKVFESRIMLQPTVCLTGAQAAELFYNEEFFQREGAAPGLLKETLLGEGSVQTKDGMQHRHRKAMFMSLMTPERRREMIRLVEVNFEASAELWERKKEIVLYEELHPLLMRASCQWAGIPITEDEVQDKTDDIAALFDKAGRVGLPHIESRMARKKMNAWAEKKIEGIRSGKLQTKSDTAAYVIAHHRDLNGDLLDPETAAVELLNIIRPLTAVSIYITFAATALYLYPVDRDEILQPNNALLDSFAQEVRRFFPLFPSAVAKVRKDFSALGYDFKEGHRVLLDLYGTNHDPNVWEYPHSFQADRFMKQHPTPFNFIPQGGGDHNFTHRCPGEWLTIEVIKVAVRFLVEKLSYTVPEQNFELDFTRLPALPKSHFIMHDIRLRQHLS